MAQNAKDGGKRTFIIIQLPEPIDPKTTTGKAALAAGYNTIADITRDRVIRAAQQIRSTDTLNLNPTLDLGFRYFRLAESNFIPYTPTDTSTPELNLQPDNIREGRTDQHIIFQLMLTLKLPLSAKTEEKTLPGGTKSWHIAEGELVVITNDLTLQALHALADELKALKTTRDLKGVVILDRCFATQADLKANARKIFEDADIPLKTV